MALVGSRVGGKQIKPQRGCSTVSLGRLDATHWFLSFLCPEPATKSLDVKGHLAQTVCASVATDGSRRTERSPKMYYSA